MVYETVGDAIMSTVLKCIKWGGRVLVVGFAGGKIPKIPANLLLVKNTDVMGVYWGAHLVHQVAFPPRHLRTTLPVDHWVPLQLRIAAPVAPGRVFGFSFEFFGNSPAR